MVSAVEMAVNPKKRVFLALVLFSAIMTAVLLFFAWKVTYLGFEAISQFLPAAFGFLVFGAIFFLFAGELAIVLAIMGMPLPKILYFWSWKAINFLFPFAVGLGRILNIPREKVEQSFVAVNNALVKPGTSKTVSSAAVAVWAVCWGCVINIICISWWPPVGRWPGRW